jgi:hypothetical protein
LFLPDRAKTPNIPDGRTPVTANGEPYEANFVKIAINTMRKPGSEENDLPAVLRGWFGPDAGRPGTRHEVAIDRGDDGYTLSPLRLVDKPALELWRSYAREQIPPLFGEKFSEAIWNVGFVAREKNLFLLITLEKGPMADGFKYADHFLAADLFQWQSQNRTTQASKHGQLIRNHAASGVAVHLFVRAAKKTPSGGSAPFIYCGDVTFDSWDGERPITVRWRLKDPVPERRWKEFGVPA